MEKKKRGRPKSEEKRDKIVNIRFTEDEISQINLMRYRDNVPMSEFIRKKIFEEPKYWR